MRQIPRPLLTMIAALALTGCSGAATTSSTTTMATTTARSASAPATDAAGGATTSRVPASTPTPTRPGPTSSAPSTEPPVVDPPRPTRPAATTAGSLDSRALPTPTGWSTAVGDGADGGYIPNGSWVNARDPRSTAREILSLACTPPPAAHPWPTDALEGTYRGPGGAHGTGEVLDFGSAREAARFVEVYAVQARSCQGVPDPVFTMTPVQTSPALVDRRVMNGDGSTWLEVVGVKGTRATFLMLQEVGGQIPRATVDAIVADLT